MTSKSPQQETPLVLDGKKPLLFLGDNHGNWNDLFSLLHHKNIQDCSLIHLGDDGVGFHRSAEKETELCVSLNERFQEKQIRFFSLRGNHCDPKYFEDPERIRLSHFELLADYTLAQWGNKTLQFIGGAISVDRKGRVPGHSYWPQEGIRFLPEKCKKVDILVTHSCPTWCHPQRFGPLVEDWARVDPTLKIDLQKEREQLDILFKKCQPTHHYYGHMHQSWTADIKNCRHRLLDINEVYEHPALTPRVSPPKSSFSIT